MKTRKWKPLNISEQNGQVMPSDAKCQMLKRVQLVHILGTAAPPSRKLHLAIDKMALSLRNLRVLGHNKEVY